MTVAWPSAGLLLRSPAVELTPMTEELLHALALRLPDDLELDPAIPLPPGELRTARNEHIVKGPSGLWCLSAWLGRMAA